MFKGSRSSGHLTSHLLCLEHLLLIAVSCSASWVFSVFGCSRPRFVHTTTEILITISDWCQGIKWSNCLTSHIQSLEHLLLIAVSSWALIFLFVSVFKAKAFLKLLPINHLPLIKGQVVKSPNLSYTIPRASSLDSSILLSSEFSQCLRVQGQGCYTFSCISANASRELWSLRKR